MATIGSRPSNEERDFMRFMKGYGGLSVEPYMLRVKMQKSRTSTRLDEISLPVIPPTELLHTIWNMNRAQFDVSFLDDANDNGCAEFWEWGRTHPWGAEHPAMSLGVDTNKVIPIVWHVDGVEFHTRSEHITYSWESILSGGTIWDKKMLLCSAPLKLMAIKSVRQKILDHITEYIAWQHKIFLEGAAWRIDREWRGGGRGNAMRMRRRGRKRDADMEDR